MPKRGPRLKSVADLSVFMGRIIRETYRGDLAPPLAGRLAYMCNVLKGCIEASDIEKRLEALEERIN